MAKLYYLEPVDYSDVSGAICDLGGAGSEEDFDDDYFLQPDMSKVSHLCPEDLEVEETEGASSIPKATDNATLPAGILCVFTPITTFQKPLLYLTNLFVTVGGEIDASLVFPFKASTKFAGIEGPSLQRL